MSTMLCKIESWSNSVISSSADREENRFFGTIPAPRKEARKQARLMSRNNPHRNYAISTWNDELKQWVNYEVYENGYEINE